MHCGSLGRARDVQDDSEGSGLRRVEQRIVASSSQAVNRGSGVGAGEMVGRCEGKLVGVPGGAGLPAKNSIESDPVHTD